MQSFRHRSAALLLLCDDLFDSLLCVLRLFTNCVGASIHPVPYEIERLTHQMRSETEDALRWRQRMRATCHYKVQQEKRRASETLSQAGKKEQLQLAVGTRLTACAFLVLTCSAGIREIAPEVDQLLL